MTIEIITSKGNYPAPFTHRILILCHEKNIPIQLTTIDTYDKPQWFLDIAPLGQARSYALKMQSFQILEPSGNI